MNEALAIDTFCAEELVEGFIGRMTAPEPEELAIEQPGWWHRGALAGLVGGLLLGALAYALGPAAEPRPDQPPAAAGSGGRPALEPGPAAAPQPAAPSSEPSSEPAGVAAAQPSQPPAAAAPAAEPAAAAEPDPAPQAAAGAAPGSKAPPKRIAHRGRRHRAPALTPVGKAQLRKGWRLYRRGDYRAGGIAFGRAVHANPKHTGGYYGLALCLFEQGKERVALQVLDRGAQKVGPKAGLWVLAGSIYQWLGKERMARLAYRRYLRNNPQGPYARDVRVILARDELPRLLPLDDGQTAELARAGE